MSRRRHKSCKPSLPDFSNVCAAPPVTFEMDEVPTEMVEFLGSKLRAERLVEECLQAAAKKVLRRLRHDIPEARRARWSKRWLTENQDETKRWLGLLVDRVARTEHLVRVGAHEVYPSLPEHLDSLTFENGGLAVNDPEEVNPSLGSRAYMEATPPEVLRWIHQWWLARSGSLGETESLMLQPNVWDLTAGSGTGLDYFGVLHASRVVSSDLIVADNRSILADCRDVGLLEQHGRERRHLKGNDVPLVISAPDLILLDPPSPGFPLHSQLYCNEPHPKDLGLLDRERWIFLVADIAIRASRHLAPNGAISLLVRCGARIDGEVFPDLSVVEDLKHCLREKVTIAHEMALSFGTRRNQASLGKARLPAVHLTLTRAT